MTAPVPPVDLDQARQQGDVVLHEDRLYVYDPAGDPAYPWTVLTGAWDRWPESHIPAERPALIAELRDLRAKRDAARALAVRMRDQGKPYLNDFDRGLVAGYRDAADQIDRALDGCS